MIKTVKFIFCFFILSVTASCSAQDSSPTDQLIEGPFNLTTDWKEIQFEKPLETVPHLTYVELMFDQAEFEPIKVDVDVPNYFLSPYRYQRLSDKKVVEIEVILVHPDGEYRVPYVGHGTRYTKLGGFLYLAYGVDTSKGKIFYPKDITFTSIKMRANIPVAIKHLFWFARYYERQPDKKWKDLHPSTIISMQ